MFTRLTLGLVEQMKDEGVSFVFNTPNPQSRPGYLKMGWEDVARVPVLVKPLRPFAALRKLMHVDGVEAGLLNTPGPPGARHVAELVEDDGLSGFLESLYANEQRFRTCRTTEYLRWRYGDIPGFQYRAVWRIDGGAGAVVIFRERARRNLTEFSLADLLISQHAHAIEWARELVRATLQSTCAHYAVASAATGSPERRALLGAGFLPVSIHGPRFTVRVLRQDLRPDPRLWPSWRASIGDLELF